MHTMYGVMSYGDCTYVLFHTKLYHMTMASVAFLAADKYTRTKLKVY